MKAEELRIGNRVSNNAMWQSSIMEFQIKSLLPHKVTTSNGLTLKYISLAGIPLTEEWLVKFGFKFKSYGYGEEEWKQWSLNGYSLNGFTCNTSGVDIKHVHQLQNLFYCLTETELTIK